MRGPGTHCFVGISAAALMSCSTATGSSVEVHAVPRSAPGVSGDSAQVEVQIRGVKQRDLAVVRVVLINQDSTLASEVRSRTFTGVPLTIKTSPGTYEIQVLMIGYYRARGRFSVGSNQLQLLRVRLAPSPGLIEDRFK